MRTLKLTLALGACAFALSAASPARADDTPISITPTEHRPNRRLLWTGVAAFAVTYTASVAGAAVAGDRISDKNLFIPLVGPWLDLGQRDCNFRGCNDDEEVIFKTMIVASGIIQGAGLLLALSSIFIPEKAETVTVNAKAKPEVHFTPVSLSGGAGLGAVGRF